MEFLQLFSFTFFMFVCSLSPQDVAYIGLRDIDLAERYYNGNYNCKWFEPSSHVIST